MVVSVVIGVTVWMFASTSFGTDTAYFGRRSGRRSGRRNGRCSGRNGRSGRCSGRSSGRKCNSNGETLDDVVGVALKRFHHFLFRKSGYMWPRNVFMSSVISVYSKSRVTDSTFKTCWSRREGNLRAFSRHTYQPRPK